MDKEQGDSIMFNGAFHDLTRRYNAAIYRSFKEVNSVNNLVLAVQINYLVCIVTITHNFYPSEFTYEDVRRQRPVMTYCCEYAHGYWDGFQKGSKLTVKLGVKLSR